MFVDGDIDICVEISVLVEIGKDQQVLDEDECWMIQNVLRFYEIKVSLVMILRIVSKYLIFMVMVEQFWEQVRKLLFF